GVADDGRPGPLRDRIGVAVVVESGMADEHDVGRLEVVGRARREGVLREERIDEDPVLRADDLVAGRAEVAEPRAHERPRIVSQPFTSATNARLIGTATPCSSAAAITAPLMTSISVRRPASKSCSIEPRAGPAR